MEQGIYSTSEVARKLGITRATLQGWIKHKKIAAPKLGRVGTVRVRLWTASDIEQLRESKDKIYHKRKAPRQNPIRRRFSTLAAEFKMLKENLGQAGSPSERAILLEELLALTEEVYLEIRQHLRETSRII